jgi:hypothetical protein
MSVQGVLVHEWKKGKWMKSDAADAEAAGASVPVAQVWFDEDSAVTIQLWAPGGWHAELRWDCAGAEAAGAEDKRAYAELVKRKLLSAAAARELAKKHPGGWVRAHGVEKLFGFSDLKPGRIPEPPAVEKPRKAKRATPAARRKWTAAERAVIDAHERYLTEVWDMNNWTLYSRYKKHLPAARRGDVDGLVDVMMNDEPEAFRAALESILAEIWDAEDWGAFVAKLEV